jgi:adenylate kinase family enzyme
MDRSRLERIVVVGTSCAGKTTLARALGGVLGLPHTELDVLHWGPDWTPVPADEFRGRIERAVAGPAWVIDGNYSAVRDLVWRRATTLVWLNYPFHLVFRRSLRRTLKRFWTREELFAGNRETLAIFDPEWIPWWVLRTFRRRRREYPQLLRSASFAHLQVLELAHPRQADRLLEALRPVGSNPVV